MKRAATCVAFAFAALWCQPAATQGVFGTITGIVVDSSGGVLPGVTVSVTNINTNVRKTLTTNDAGVYSATSLIPGAYSVEASLPGFKTAVVDSVVLEVNASRKVDLALEVGQGGGSGERQG